MDKLYQVNNRERKNQPSFSQGTSFEKWTYVHFVIC